MNKFFQKDRWWTLLIFALIVLSLWVVIVVYGRVSNAERAQNSNNTEADLYWFEQTVGGQIDLSQRQTVTMLNDIARRGVYAPTFNHASSQLIDARLAMVKMSWFDAAGLLREENMRSSRRNTEVMPSARQLMIKEAIKQAGQYNTAVTAGVFLMSDGDYEISLVQPLYSDTNQLVGFAENGYSLRTLFKAAVPTWFVNKYSLSVYHDKTLIYSSTHNAPIVHDQKQPVAMREMQIGALALSMKAQILPDNQVWVLQALFVGMVFLLLTLLISLVALLLGMRRRRKTEQQLMTQNSLREAIESSLTVGIRAHSLDGTMIYVNPAFCDMIEYSAEEILNIPPPLPYVPKEEVPKLLAVRDRLLLDPSGESMVELKMRKKSGEVIDTIMRGGPMYGENGEHIGWITSVEDVTERKRLELSQENEQKRIESVNHLISMGEMASAIAHELNQPLSAISGYATGLSNYIQKDEKALSRERLIDVTEKIRRQAERAANVTRRVQQFAKQKTLAPMDVDVSILIEQVIDFMELEVRQRGCKIVNHVAGLELPRAFIDNTMAQQILINILRNAIDVMTEYNVIDKRIDIYAEPYSAHHILLTVTDKGPGVAPDKVEIIFQPFYTTKTQGIGIGLNICRTMIESNGGRLWAKSDEQGGIFYLTIPIGQNEPSVDDN